VAGREQEALLADSVGLALLVVLDCLTLPERVAFLRQWSHFGGHNTQSGTSTGGQCAKGFGRASYLGMVSMRRNGACI
jgi:hypothetical protein